MKTNHSISTLLLIATFCAVSCDKDDADTGTGLNDLYLFDINNNKTTRITSSPNQREACYSISPDSKKYYTLITMV